MATIEAAALSKAPGFVAKELVFPMQSEFDKYLPSCYLLLLPFLVNIFETRVKDPALLPSGQVSGCSHPGKLIPLGGANEVESLSLTFSWLLLLSTSPKERILGEMFTLSIIKI